MSDKIMGVVWFGLVLGVALWQGFRVIAGIDFFALITWPGILALPLALLLGVAGAGAIAFFGGMIVYILREKRDQR